MLPPTVDILLQYFGVCVVDAHQLGLLTDDELFDGAGGLLAGDW